MKKLFRPIFIADHPYYSHQGAICDMLTGNHLGPIRDSIVGLREPLALLPRLSGRIRREIPK